MNDLTIANRAIGVDVGTHSVKIVAIQQRMGAPSIEKISEAVIERGADGAVSPEATLSALRRALEGIRIRKDMVVLGVSTQSAAVRTIQIPFSDINKARAVIKFQAETHLPFAIDEVIVDFIDTKTGTKERMDVLLTAIRKQILQEEVNVARDAGLDPEVIEVDFMAGCNTINTSIESSNEGVLFIDIGASKTIVVLIKDGTPLALRSFAIGGDAVTNAIVKELNIPFAEAEELKKTTASAVIVDESPEKQKINNAVKAALDRFNGELLRTVRFLSQQLNLSPQSKIILTGGGALLKGMPEYIEETLGHKTSILKSIGNLRDNSGGNLNPACFATTIGLALRGIGESRFLQNFRQEELAYSRAYKRMRKSILTSFILIGAIIITYITGLVIQKIKLNSISNSLNLEIRKVITSALGSAPASNDPKALVDTLGGAVDRKRTELKNLRGAGFLSVLEVMKELSTIIDADYEVEITLFRISDTETDKGPVLQFEGSAKSKEDIIAIENKLSKSGLFNAVRGEGITENKPRNRYNFKFRAEIKESQ